SHLLRATRDLVRAVREPFPFVLGEAPIAGGYPSGDALALVVTRFGKHEDRRSDLRKQPACVHRVRELFVVALRIVQGDRTERASHREPPLAEFLREDLGIFWQIP